MNALLAESALVPIYHKRRSFSTDRAARAYGFAISALIAEFWLKSAWNRKFGSYINRRFLRIDFPKMGNRTNLLAQSATGTPFRMDFNTHLILLLNRSGRFPIGIS